MYFQDPNERNSSNNFCSIPAVIEFGGLNTRSGFAGEDKPTRISSTVILKVKNKLWQRSYK